MPAELPPKAIPKPIMKKVMSETVKMIMFFVKTKD
jgi:hypothetical protein